MRPLQLLKVPFLIWKPERASNMSQNSEHFSLSFFQLSFSFFLSPQTCTSVQAGADARICKHAFFICVYQACFQCAYVRLWSIMSLAPSRSLTSPLHRDECAALKPNVWPPKLNEGFVQHVLFPRHTVALACDILIQCWLVQTSFYF